MHGIAPPHDGGSLGGRDKSGESWQRKEGTGSVSLAILYSNQLARRDPPSPRPAIAATRHPSIRRRLQAAHHHQTPRLHLPPRYGPPAHQGLPESRGGGHLPGC